MWLSVRSSGHVKCSRRGAHSGHPHQHVDGVCTAALMCLCVCVCMSDRPGVTNASAVERIQDIYVDTLTEYVKKRRVDGSRFLAHLLMKLVDLRTINCLHTDCLYRVTIAKGSLPPLLREYFDIPHWVVSDTPTQLRQLSHASLRGQVPASVGAKGGNVASVGWQVTPCDAIWRVSSRSGEAGCQPANCYTVCHRRRHLTLVHSTRTELNWLAARPSVMCLSVVTWLAAVKLGRLVLSWFVHRWKARVQNCSSCAANKPLC